MSHRPPDEAFGQHLLKAGFVTEAELRTAKGTQAERAAQGQPLPLGDILVEQGLLTAVQREKAEKKLEVQRDEANRLGPYRILKKLGEGGMGTVYLAEDPANQEPVALKVLPKVAAQDADAIRRFMREVDLAQKLEHPNIVRAGAGGQDKGLHYFVMEYVEGETLGARLRREAPLSPEEATQIVLQVANGLKYAHGLGFIHRDIKPDNVILAKGGVAKLLDMGLSKNIQETETFRTVTGVALGTPHYIAPEQAQGEKGVDGRADIYSLGATYYHLVTGETPFQGATALELMSQHVHKQIPDPRDLRDGIPEGVVHVIRRMMAKKPEDRYRDCADLMTDLELLLGGQGPSSQALEAARSAVALPMAQEARERFRSQRRRQRPGTYRSTAKARPSSVPLAVGGVVGALILVLVLALTLGGGRDTPPERGPVSAKSARPDPSKVRDSAPTTVEAAPAQRSREDLRSGEARRKLNEIRAAEKQHASDEIRRRYTEFAKDFADTQEGKTVARWLRETEPARSILANEKSTDPPPVESPKPTELPKPSEPAEPPAADVKPPPPADQIKSPPAPRRPPAPDPGKLAESEAAVRKTFPIDKAKSARERADLARMLLETASTSGAKDAELYALLRIARDLAAQGMDPKTAIEAIDARMAAFEGDGLAEKLELFSKASAKGPDAAIWAGAALEVAREAWEADDYDSALKIAGRAESLARAANDRALQEAAKDRSREATDLKRAADSLKTQFKTLEAKPDDPSANTAVGKFLSLLKGDWKRGLPMLAKGSDATLKTLAEQELGNPTDPEGQAALGGAWKALAEHETPTYRTAARERAREWLGRAVPKLTGLKRVSAQRDWDSLGAGIAAKRRDLLDPGGLSMELVALKPGSFAMGSGEALKEGLQFDERPEHRVTITRGFSLGKYPVTRGQFAAFVKATNYRTDAEKDGKSWGRQADGVWTEIAGVTWKDPQSFKQSDDHPAICVSWNDAKAFCDWAAKKTGREVRLPTEAEWEYACRARTKTRWWFGDTETPMAEYAWTNANAGWQTQPVGLKKPNPWGLYDMYGNVWAWCQDWAAPYPTGDAVDPTGPAAGIDRCLRGGSYMHGANVCCSTNRGSHQPFDRSQDGGFRVCVP